MNREKELTKYMEEKMRAEVNENETKNNSVIATCEEVKRVE